MKVWAAVEDQPVKPDPVVKYAPEMLGLLRELASFDESQDACPVCRNCPHSGDCRLAALLARIESTNQGRVS